MSHDPLRNFKFRVEIDGVSQSGFNEVIMPAATIQVIEYREGNEATQSRKLSGQTGFGNIILKWGITGGNDLYQWWKEVSQTGAQSSRRNMSVVLIDEEGNDRVRWNFEKAWPVRYRPSDLDAENNEVAMEALEITFERMTKDIY
jgi:phage tail-like protein